MKYKKRVVSSIFGLMLISIRLSRSNNTFGTNIDLFSFIFDSTNELHSLKLLDRMRLQFLFALLSLGGAAIAAPLASQGGA